MASNYKINFQAEIKNIKSIEQQVSQLQRKINNVASSGLSKSAKESAKALNSIFSKGNLQTIEKYGSIYSSQIASINQQSKSINELAKNLKTVKGVSKEAGTEIENMGEKLSSVSNSTEKASKANMTFTQRVKEALKSSVQWTIAMGGLYGAIHKVQDAISSVITLDNQMTNIRMVTGASTEQAKEYLRTFQGIAEQTSSTTSEVARSAEEFLRQGRSIADTNELIKTSSVFSKVAFLDSVESAQLLTSAINGYQLSAKDAMGVVDKLSAVDVASATGADDLARALRQTASSAKIAGVSMDDLIGYVATVQDVTQKSADSINKICGVATIINKVA